MTDAPFSEVSTNYRFALASSFAEACMRMRKRVVSCSTSCDHLTRYSVWPGKKPVIVINDISIIDRENEYAESVIAEVQHRCEIEEEFFRILNPGEAS